MSHLLPGGSVSVDRKQFSCSDLHLHLDGAFSSAWWWPCDYLFTPILGHCWDSAAMGVWLLGRKETQLSVQKALNYYIKYIHVRGSCAFIYRNIKYCKTLGTPAISSHKGKEPHQAHRAIRFKLFVSLFGWALSWRREGVSRVWFWLHCISLRPGWCFHFVLVLFSEESAVDLINAIKSMTFN